jgi:glycine cleavage system H lipoate-binding protein
MTAIKRCFLIPPDEQLCIWMTAGVLSYQLCNRMLDCDNCPIDAVMHRRFSESPAVEEGENNHMAPRVVQDIPEEGFQYSRNHWWARKTDSGKIRLGIESGFAQTLLGVKGIVFPAPHQRLCKGQACIWVVMDGSTLALESPLDGVVQTVNHDLIDKPHLLRLQPFDDGWLCEIESEDAEAEAAGLLTAVDIRPKYSADRTRFLASLSGAMRGRRPPIGTTLADGGEQLQNCADILGAIRYIALLRHHFGWTKKG